MGKASRIIERWLSSYKTLAKNINLFALLDEILYFVREKSDGSLHNSLTIFQSLTVQALQHAHELSGNFGQKKTIKKTAIM